MSGVTLDAGALIALNRGGRDWIPRFVWWRSDASS